MELSKHLTEVLEKQIPKKKWFTKDDVIIISRTDWVLGELVNAGILKKEFRFGEVKYYYKVAVLHNVEAFKQVGKSANLLPMNRTKAEQRTTDY